MTKTLRFGLIFAAALGGAAPALAQEATLRAVTSFQEGTFFSRNFERFIEKVNADGKGLVKIQYVGWPRAVPPFEVGNAVRTRVADMANVTGAFYTNLMPEADGLKLATKPMSEQRRNGAWEFVDKLHNDKLNAHFLARQHQNVPFHLYFNAKPYRAKLAVGDLAGLKVRVTPVYKDLVEALGGTTVTTPPGEVHTAMERGVVDGYGWPVMGIFDLGWQSVTKLRLDPGFFNVDVNVLVNLDAWKGLNAAQRKVLSDAALWLEALDAENVAAMGAERDRQTQAGVQALALSEAEAKKFVARAHDVAWTSVIRRAPETGPRLRQLIAD